MSRPKGASSAPLMLVLLLAAPLPVLGQEAPTVRSVISGFGSVTYSGLTQGPYENDFRALFAPLVLYQVNDDLLFEGELDIELEESVTRVNLEHAVVHYLGFERVRLSAGMLHLPFGTWHHSRWVNRLPAPPLLYEDSHGAPPSEGVLPIMFDVGAMASLAIPLGEWSGSASVWVSQGPSDNVSTHSHGSTGQPQRPDSDASNLGYGSNFEDNNSDKMVGLRFRATGTGMSFQVSGFRAKYDAQGELGVSGLNASVMWMPGSMTRPLLRLHAEGTLLDQEYIDSAASEQESALYGGYYLEVSKRLGGYEPVVRWSHLLSEVAGGERVLPKRRQTLVGVNYWLTPSSPVKAAYSFEPDGTDYLSIEWTVGF